jgi:hypothetical protein
MRRRRSAIFRHAGRTLEPRRIEKLPLQLAADLVHDAGADLAFALQGGGHGLQESITIANVERSGHGEHASSSSSVSLRSDMGTGGALYAARSRSMRSIALSGSGQNFEMPSDSILRSSATSLGLEP